MFNRLSTHAHGPVTRPLVVRFGSMGDMVIALSLIHALHRRCGELVDVVSSGSWTRPLLESQPGVGNLYLIRSRKTPYAVSPQQQQLVRTLSKYLQDYERLAAVDLVRAGSRKLGRP